MARDGLLTLVCAGAMVTAGLSNPAAAAAGDNRETVVTTALAVQTALQQGREHLLHGEYKAAVSALEGQLAYINGNQVYLKLLQDAYRGYVKELRLAKQEEEAQRYLRRLLILDRGALLDAALNTSSTPLSASPPKPATKPSPPEKPAPTVRLMSEDTPLVTKDDDPFHSSRALDKPERKARALLDRAEQEFGNRRYREARLLYEEANQADKTATDPCRERWAYCKLFHVVEQMNHAATTPANWPELEQEVQGALDLAPRLAYGKYLLAEIQKRRGGTPSRPPVLDGASARDSREGLASSATAEASRAEPAVPLRHFQRQADGWSMAESPNFRIYYTLSPEWAARAAQVAERTRATLQQKWFGALGETWNPKCDLFLHATCQDYSRATGQQNSPGHSSLKMENGRLVVRRIDLHCDDPNLLGAVLPHETTHVVLAGEFGEQLVPRWADEGMAVLTEPRAKVERHLNNLAKCRQDGTLFRLQDLMQLDDYPRNPRYIGAFYAQSVSLVDYLSGLRGPQHFTLFLQEGMRYGYEKALLRHYGYKNFAELEQRWGQCAFQERATLTSFAERDR
jgi:tetratricopeptide (TPR) repeat protein